MPEPIILIVDDTEANIDILVESLGDTYELAVAMDGQTALDITYEMSPDLILLDIMMPGMSGYEVCEILKENPRFCSIPIIFLTAMNAVEDEAKGLALGAVDYITKPFNPGLVNARVHNHLELRKHQTRLEELVQERTRELQLVQDVTIESMGILAEYRDPETGGHIRRTQHYVGALARRLQQHPHYREFLTETTIQMLVKSAPLHDIGKVAISDNVLLKPGKLTDDEYVAMKRHAELGYEGICRAEKRLGQNSFLCLASEIANTHHEKWDGSGYPCGLAGDTIPIPGRLMAIADVYDALISKRCYKAPFPHSKAVAIIAEGRGTHFDPEMVDAFQVIHEEFREIALAHVDHDEERQSLVR